ncbi:MAG: tetratricopeptide repeat protein, partial [Anaerolineales bacterium]|nr:tetratricopeptide repeat protein [Anaerolineales bacterium]
VLAGWGQAYGFDFDGLADLESRAAAVRSMLAERQALIVLDDVAQISRIRPLLPTSGRCALLLTTRDQDIAYGLDTEPILLNELSPADSLQLLQRILGEARVNAELEAAQAICTLLQNLPLAVEIAAQRLRSHRRRRLSDMAHRLQDTQQRLGLAISDQAVRTSFTLSWQALDLPQQRLFSLLAVFAGRPFTPNALAYVADLDLYTTEDILFALTSLSLVKEEGHAAYRQHPLLADFAQEKLTDPDTAYRLMTGYYYTFSQEFAADYDKLRPEWDNIAAAIEVAHRQQLWPRVLAFADVLTPAWKARGRYTQARQAYRLAHDAARQLDVISQLAVNFLRWGEACIEQNDYDEAKNLLTDSLAAYQQQSDQDGIARVQFHLARIAIEQNEHEKAERLLDNSQAIWVQLNSQIGVASAIFRRAMLQYNLGEFVTAKKLLEEALQIQEAVQDKQGMMPTLRLLAQIPLAFQTKEEIEEYSNRAYQLSQDLNDKAEMAATLFTLTVAYRQLRDVNTAFQYAKNGLELLKHMGLQRTEAFVLFEISMLLEIREDFQEAIRAANESMQILKNLQDLIMFNRVKMHLGDLYQQLNQKDLAKNTWLEVAKYASEAKQHILLIYVNEKLSML